MDHIFSERTAEIKFEKEKHVAFFKYALKSLGSHSSMEAHKITVLYFIVGGLCLLKSFTEEEKDMCVRFVFNNAIIDNYKVIGFRGGNFSGWSFNKEYSIINTEDKPHIAATYCALCILKMCSYDSTEKINLKTKSVLGNNDLVFDAESIIKEIQLSQNTEGQICAQRFESENDVRFFYCAMAIFIMLKKTSQEIKSLISFELSKKFLSSIRNYEGGFSMIEQGESNAGLTYCAVTSYHILDLHIPNINNLIHWLCNRNSALGPNGRTNKVPDTCYSFWVMGSLYILDKIDLFDREHTLQFLLNCQTSKGGFSKHLNFDGTESPDLLHSFYSLASLSILKYDDLNEFNPILAMCL